MSSVFCRRALRTARVPSGPARLPLVQVAATHKFVPHETQFELVQSKLGTSPVQAHQICLLSSAQLVPKSISQNLVHIQNNSWKSSCCILTQGSSKFWPFARAQKPFSPNCPPAPTSGSKATMLRVGPARGAGFGAGDAPPTRLAWGSPGRADCGARRLRCFR